jgi:hypothetical protein
MPSPTAHPAPLRFRANAFRRPAVVLALAALLIAVIASLAVIVSRHRTLPAVLHPQLVWAPPGSRPLPDSVARRLVTPRPEQHPENVPANRYVPTAAELRSFYTARDSEGQPVVRFNPLLRYVTGNSGLADPSTDELIQWAAHKWGIPEDLMRAQLTVESGMRMTQLGDRRSVGTESWESYPLRARIAGGTGVYESMGIAQVKWLPDGSVGAGTEPLRWRSTAFNLDVYAATLRYYYDGRCRWCGPGYRRGEPWQSVGAWFSPQPWDDPAARTYVARVRTALEARTWE